MFVILLILQAFSVLNLIHTAHLISYHTYKPENNSEVSDPSCIIKSCLHSNSACNLLFFFVASIDSISSLLHSPLLFANKVFKLFIDSSNFHISSYS